MADYNLGTARGRIEIDSTSVPKGFKQAEVANAGLLGTLRKTSPALSSIGKGMAVVGGLAVAGFALAVKTSADFEKRISAIGAVSGATGKELDQIRSKALQLGKDTKFSASEAASAMEELAKAGVSTSDILGGAADATVALAAAGEVELPRAAEIASNAMNVFNIKASEMPHVADQIAGAANASAISVDEYAMSLQQSGAAAKLAGVSFEDLTTAIALMGNAGIKGSDAGTSLKTMLLNLNPATKRQKELMKDLGIITKDGANQFFDAQGKAKGLADIADVLNTALAGMTKQQKLATLETLFGADAIRASAIIADKGSKGFNELAGAIGKVKAADVAAKRMDNLAGSLEQLKGSLETAFIQVGAPAQAGIRALVDGATKLVNAFLKLSPATQALASHIAVFGGGALLIAGSLTLAAVKIIEFAVRVRQAIVAIKAFGIASKLAFLTNPVFLFIAAIVAVVAALVILFKRNKAFHDFVMRAWNGILNIVHNVVNAFKAFASAFSGEGITSEAGSLVGVFERIGVAARAVFNFLKNNWPLLLAILTGPIGLAVFAIIKNWNTIKGAAQAAVRGVVTAWNAVVGFFTALPGRVARGFIAFGNFMLQLPQRAAYAVGFIIGRFLLLLARLPDIIGRLTVAGLAAFARFVTGLITGAVRVAARVLAAVGSMAARLPGIVARGATAAASAFARAAVAVINAAIRMGSRVVSSVTSFFGRLPGIIGRAASSAASAFVRALQALPGAAGRLASAAARAIQSGIAAIPGIVSGIVGRAISMFTGAIGRAFSAARNLASSLWNGFKAGLGIGSPSLIERAMFSLNKNFGKELNTFQKQHADLAKVGRAFAENPFGVPTITLPAPIAAGARGGDGAVNLNFDFRGGTFGAGAGDEVRQAVTSPRLLKTLVQAARARGA